MRTILTFIGGALFGAVAMFLFLHQYPVDNDAAQVAATTQSAPSAVAQPAAPLAGAPTQPGQLGPVPQQDVPAQPLQGDLSAQAGGAQGSLAAGASHQDGAAQPGVAQENGGARAGAAAQDRAGDSASEGAQHAGQVPPGLEGLLLPVEGVDASQLNDTFAEARGKARHEAIDIIAPKGTKVYAVSDGKVVKLFNSKPGGLTVYQFDPSATYAFYYAHLDRYAKGLKEGMVLKRGDLVGYVGNTGNADPATPHLHFAVFELTPEKQWWKGSPINPYPLLGGQPAKSGTGRP